MQQLVKIYNSMFMFKLIKTINVAYWSVRDVFKVVWITLLLAWIRAWKTPVKTHRKIKKGDRLKVCIVSEYYYPTLGGITEHVHNIAKHFLRKGHEVTLVTSNAGDPKGRGDLGGLRIFRVGRSKEIYSNGSIARIAFGWRLHKELDKIFRENEFDVVHIHSPITPSLPLLVPKYIRCPSVATYHTDFDKSAALAFWRKLAQGQLDTIDAIAAVSPVAIRAMGRYLDPRGKERVIPNGVDTEWFYPRQERLPHLDDGRPNILYIGRFDPRNGFTTVVKAFSIVKKTIKNARLVVIGYGPLQRYYLSKIPAELEKDIIYVGKTDLERPQYFSSCDVMCVPTRKATCSLIILEALATKTPIVASGIEGFKKIVQHEKEILFVPDFEPESYAQGILRILQDRELRERIRENGRLKARSMDWRIIAEKTLDMYYDALEAETEQFREEIVIPLVTRKQVPLQLN
jgi:phosphatidylinositol alpha-mannosyltransferase